MPCGYAGAFDECRDNEKTCFRVSGHKLEVFICQIREEIRNPLTAVSYLLIKAAQKTGMLLEIEGEDVSKNENS